EVRLFDNNFFPRPLPTRLLARLLRPADHHALAERVEPMHQNAAETAAIGDQKRYRSDSPDDAQHSEETTRQVSLQRDPSLENDFNQHVRVCFILQPRSAGPQSDQSMLLFALDT